MACAVSVSPAAYLPQPPLQVHPIFRSTPQIPRDFRMSEYTHVVIIYGNYILYSLLELANCLYVIRVPIDFPSRESIRSSV